MNVADSDVVRAVMMGAGYRWVDAAEGADVVFLNTCAIRGTVLPPYCLFCLLLH